MTEVYLVWLQVEDHGEYETAYWDEANQRMVIDVVGGIFSALDEAQRVADSFPSDMHAHVQSFTLNTVLWKVEQ